MSDEKRALQLLTLALVVASIATFAAFWAPLVLAAWIADVLQPLVRELERRLDGRRRAAAAVVALLVTVGLAPIVGAVAAAVAGLRELFAQATAALEGGTFAGLLSGGAEAPRTTFGQWADLASRYGANAWRAVSVVARMSISVLLMVLVFVTALYAFAASGARTYRWLARHAPIPHDAFTRLARAFRETGRGLIIGGGGTALVQGLLATVAYVAIGIPRAMLLGPLTAACALVPAVGTGLVWIPIAIELAVSGDYVRAAVMAGVGAGVLSLIDNFIRPILTRHGRLNLPTLVVLVSMLGGIAAFGATGALLGPLVVRMTVEALAIMRERAVARRASTQ